MVVIQTCKTMRLRYFVYKTLLLINAPLDQEELILKPQVDPAQKQWWRLLNEVLSIIRRYRMALLVAQPCFQKSLLQFYITKCTLTSLFWQRSTLNICYSVTKHVWWTWSVKTYYVQTRCTNLITSSSKKSCKQINNKILLQKRSSYVVSYCGLIFVVFERFHFYSFFYVISFIAFRSYI